MYEQPVLLAGLYAMAEPYQEARLKKSSCCIVYSLKLKSFDCLPIFQCIFHINLSKPHGFLFCCDELHFSKCLRFDDENGISVPSTGALECIYDINNQNVSSSILLSVTITSFSREVLFYGALNCLQDLLWLLLQLNLCEPHYRIFLPLCIIGFLHYLKKVHISW